MYDEEQNGGFLTDVTDTPGRQDGDPLAAVRAVADPRSATNGTDADHNLPDSEHRFRQDESRMAGPDGIEPPDRHGSSDRPETPPEGDYGEFAWPDGYVADPKAMAKFVPLARKLGLPRESAQKLAGLYADLDQEKQRSQAEFIAKNNAEWLREIHGHPEFSGHNLQRTADGVASTMRRFGTPLLLAQVRQMNIQNWPEMFFFLARVSQAVSEDCSPSSGAGDAPAKSTAQLLFPGLK